MRPPHPDSAGSGREAAVCIEPVSCMCREEQRKRVSVYNCASSSTKPITMGEMVDMGLSGLHQIPIGGSVWVPSAIITPSFWLYWVIFVLTHILPALVADLGLRLIGNKFRLMKVQRKLYSANTALAHFTTRTWVFDNDALLDLDTQIPLKDRPAFAYAIVDREPKDFFDKAILGGRRYLTKRGDEHLEADRVQYRR